jgi:hypothetical protein
MADCIDARIEAFRNLVAHSYELDEEQKKCINIIFSPGGYTTDEAFEAIAKWTDVTDERKAVIHRMAEFYILCPHLRHSFLKVFSEAKQKRESYRDW